MNSAEVLMERNAPIHSMENQYRAELSNNLIQICQLAYNNKHRAKLPGYENTHLFYLSLNGYVHFINTQLPKNNVLTGWKFSISIHPKDLSRAWLLIKDILLCNEQGILAFKVLDVQGIVTGHTKNRDQIILYTFKNPAEELLQTPEDIFKILIAVEKTLRVNKIRAGIAKEANLKIAGSRYFSMRNDRDINSDYISAEEAITINPRCPHNPFQVENPFQWFAMNDLRHRFFSKPGFGFYEPNDYNNDKPLLMSNNDY